MKAEDNNQKLEKQPCQRECCYNEEGACSVNQNPKHCVKDIADAYHPPHGIHDIDDMDD